MVETLKFGISINRLLQSGQNTTTNHGTSRTQEKLMTCKSGVLTLDGGNSSNSLDLNSLTSNITTESLILPPKILKVNQLES
jgi:hypothetical protein